MPIPERCAVHIIYTNKACISSYVQMERSDTQNFYGINPRFPFNINRLLHQILDRVPQKSPVY